MVTHYLGSQEVDAYLADFLQRISNFGDTRPTVWLPIGPSGRILARRLLQQRAAPVDETVIVPVHFDRPTKAVTMEIDSVDDIANKNLLVLDSAAHSGATMLAVVRKAQELRAAMVVSYSLVLKRKSTFVPTFWGLTIGDHDRAYFLLDNIPNNRLRSRFGGAYLRQLVSEDVASLPPMLSGLEAMDRITWADRWFDIQCSERERSTYLLYVDRDVAGYITFAISERYAALTVDEVAVREDLRGQGLGGALLRWAETTARQVGASELNMWAIEDQVPKYEKLGYATVPGVSSMKLEAKDYFFMRKRVVYLASPMKMDN